MRYQPISEAKYRLDPVWLAFLLTLPFLLLVPITHDAIWQIWIGGQILDGARLYTDIIEVNPPLWFWLAAPLAGLGELTGLHARYIIVAFFAGSIALSLYLSPRRYRFPLLLAATLLPLMDFGQREHFTLIATAPYVFLVASRMNGEPLPHAWLIGFYAALGLALKPFFLVVPIALELLAWSKPRIRPETTALAISAIAYTISLLIFAGNYLTVIVPLVRESYGAFTAADQASNTPWIALGLALFGAALGRRAGSATSRALLTASIAFIPAVLFQAKGWAYHTIPVRGFLLLAISVELLQSRRNLFGDCCLFAGALLCFLPLGVYKNASIRRD